MLQKVGQAEKTTDENYTIFVVNFNKQQVRERVCVRLLAHDPIVFVSCVSSWQLRDFRKN